MMKRFAVPLLLCLSAAPVLAQDDDGLSLMDQGARLFLRGLMSELEPTLDELEGMAQEIKPGLQALADEMGPALAQIIARIDDLRYYEAPVILENGDILIRRRAEAPAYVPSEPEVTPQVEPEGEPDAEQDQNSAIDL